MKICYSIINNINIKINIYNKNVTQCYCAWIVAVFCVLPILPLFDLHFCKVRLHFSYVTFHLLFSSSLCQNPRHAILVRHACHLWHLIDFKRFFSAMSLAKTCQHCRQNGKSLILKEFLFVKCVMSLLKNAQAQIIITSHCCILMQRYSISNATI